jgi:hypothetical protein
MPCPFVQTSAEKLGEHLTLPLREFDLLFRRWQSEPIVFCSDRDVLRGRTQMNEAAFVCIHRAPGQHARMMRQEIFSTIICGRLGWLFQYDDMDLGER